VKVGRRGRLILGAVFGFIASLTALPGGGAVNDFSGKIPQKIGAFLAEGEDKVYDRKSLFDYMDGGAEVYLAFDFREVWKRRYAGPGGRELALDIFDMGTPGEAFGVFSCDRQDPGVGIGQDSEYGFGLLRFWQGRYFVSVTASAEDEETGKTVLKLGQEVVKHLGPPGDLPELVNLLPRPSLRTDRTSFFHESVSLNNRFFVSAENILGLDRATDCVLAEYDPGPGGTAYLLLIRYPDAEKSMAARRTFLEAYIPEAGPEGLARTENHKWVGAFPDGPFLAVVFDAPEPDWARRLMASLRLPKK
jgi:Family of unknown function (DUF6599)